MRDIHLDISAVKYVSYDGLLELRLKILQVWCPSLSAYSTVMCGRPYEMFAHVAVHSTFEL